MYSNFLKQLWRIIFNTSVITEKEVISISFKDEQIRQGWQSISNSCY